MNTKNHKIIWAMGCAYSSGVIISAHSHAFYHYFYAKKGSGIIKIGDKHYQVKSGSIYLFSPNTVHEIHSGDNMLEAYEIKFDLYDSEMQKALGNLPEEIFLADGVIERIFEDLFAEMRDSLPYREDMLNIKFSEFLTRLLRCNESKQPIEERSASSSERFAKVVSYINNNLADSISLQSLADIAHLDKIYFLKQFKAEMHTTPMNYLRMLRMREAKKLLAHSDMNITQVASAVGIPDVHHFSGLFKKTFNVSPSEYKASKIYVSEIVNS